MTQTPTIVVRDEAGKEVQRREFRNALQGQGKPTLASLLSRGRAISEWMVLLGNGSLQYFNGLQPCGKERRIRGLLTGFNGLEPFENAFTRPSRRNVHHSPEADVVVRVDQQAQVGDRFRAGLPPVVHGVRTQVTTVQVGVGAGLLDDEHVHPEREQGVELVDC